MAIYKGDQRILGIGATGDYAGATVLWENPDPTAAITTMDIELSSDDYDVLDIYWNWSNDGNMVSVSSYPKGTDMLINGSCSLSEKFSDGFYNISRNIIHNNDTSFTIYMAFFHTSTNLNERISSNYVIPVKIVGRKLGTDKKILESVLTSDVTANDNDASTCPLTLQPGTYFLSVRNISEANAWIGVNGEIITDRLDPTYMVTTSVGISSILINIDTETTFSIANRNGRAVTYMKGTYIKAYKLN